MSSRHLPAPHLRGWTITNLASIEVLTEAWTAGKVDEIDRLRAIWRLRAFVDAADERDPDRLLALQLLGRLDRARTAPPAPTIAKLRWQVETAYRAGPPGSLHRLAIHAGLHRADLSRFRGRGSLAADKVDRLAAALIAARRSSR